MNDKFQLSVQEYSMLIEYIKTLEKVSQMKPIIEDITRQIQARILEQRKQEPNK